MDHTTALSILCGIGKQSATIKAPGALTPIERMNVMRTLLDASCSLHVLKGKDTGIYKCKNCKYCKNARQAMTGTYVGECVNPKKA